VDFLKDERKTQQKMADIQVDERKKDATKDGGLFE
jgi:hypothetical protein